jgi:hypothetical protein
MKRGRPKTPDPSASTERSRKSRERAARKARKEKIMDKHWPQPFPMVPQPREPIAVTMPATLLPKDRKPPPYSWAELRRRRREKD